MCVCVCMCVCVRVFFSGKEEVDVEGDTPGGGL